MLQEFHSKNVQNVIPIKDLDETKFTFIQHVSGRYGLSLIELEVEVCCIEI